MTKVAVVRFPGSNCDLDTLRAAEAAGAAACEPPPYVGGYNIGTPRASSCIPHPRWTFS
jgi:hypothetical protein